MTTIEEIEQELEKLATHRRGWQRAYDDAGDDEAAAFYQQRIARINAKCKRLCEELDRLIAESDCDNCDGAGHYLLHSDTYGTDDDVLCWCCNGTGKPGGVVTEATR